MCDKDPTCEHPGSHAEWVRQIMNLALEQSEYEGKDLTPQNLGEKLNKAVRRREERSKEKLK